MKKKLVIFIYITFLKIWCTTGLTTLSGLVQEKTTKKPQKCVSEVTYRMNGYDCADIDLKEIPKYLKSNTEILDASFNRIRTLDRTSFSHLPYLKYLYLHENIIQTIEEGTFSALTDLEALDLSVNGLRTIPLEIFQLPLLRNLYVQNNDLSDLGQQLQKLIKPVKAPIAIFDLSLCKLLKMPQFGMLPNLHTLNISFNTFRQMTPQDFSPYCNLKKVDMNGTKLELCSCLTTTAHLRRRGVIFSTSSTCEATAPSQAKCGDTNNEIEETEEYFTCTQHRKTVAMKEKSSMTWMTIAGVLLLFFVLFICFLYCLHRRNVKQIKKQIKKSKLKAIPKINEEKGNHEVLLDVDKS